MNGNGGPSWKWLVGILLLVVTSFGGHLYGQLRERVAAVEAKTEALIVSDTRVAARLENIQDDVSEMKQILRAFTRSPSPRTIP